MLWGVLLSFKYSKDSSEITPKFLLASFSHDLRICCGRWKALCNSLLILVMFGDAFGIVGDARLGVRPSMHDKSCLIVVMPWRQRGNANPTLPYKPSERLGH